MDENIVIPVVAIISTFATLFGIPYIWLTTRNKERMAMIERGFDINQLIPKEEKSTYKNSALKWGLLFSGSGLGAFLGTVLARLPYFRFWEAGIIIPMILLFGGLGLVIYYLISSKKEKNINN